MRCTCRSTASSRFLDAKLTAGRAQRVRARCSTRRIDERVPAAYLTQEAWLGEFRFHVDERVLIPRSFIAELLPDGLAPYVPDRSASHIRARSLHGFRLPCRPARARVPRARTSTPSTSAADALAVAQRNVSDYGLAGRINLIRSDLFANLPGKSYDLIISNPPYVTTVAMEDLPREYRHEPALALAGGDDGLDAVRTILRKAPQFMQRDGTARRRDRPQPRRAPKRRSRGCRSSWLSTPSSEASVFLLKREEIVAGR